MEIDNLYRENFGEKIPYTWHRHYTAFTGKFDASYIPESIYIAEFERFMNLWPQYTGTFTDKNILPLIASNTNIKSPFCILSCTRGMYRSQYDCAVLRAEVLDIVKKYWGRVFCKPTIGIDSGGGCFIADFSKGRDSISGKSSNEIIELLGKNFVIQEKLRGHESISRIYPDTVNTFRVISYRWHDEINYFPPTMRIGRDDPKTTIGNWHILSYCSELSSLQKRCS